MSCKSTLSSSLKSNCEVPQWMRSHSSEHSERVMFAGDQAKDRLYEPKHKKKLVRVLTVIAYIFSVSLAAIMLSLYYVFLYPKYNSKGKAMVETTTPGTTVLNGTLPTLPRVVEDYQEPTPELPESYRSSRIRNAFYNPFRYK